MYKLPALVLLMLTAAGCAASHDTPVASSLPCLGAPSHAVAADVALVGEWTDDHAVAARIVAGATRLADAGRTTAMTEVRKGLSTPACDVALQVPAAVAAVAPPQLYESAAEATVVVAGLYNCGRCNNWHTNNASGFFISDGGLLVTNYHVADNDDVSAMVVATRDGRTFPVTAVLAANEVADVAILQVDPIDADGKAATFAALPLSESSKVGEDVYSVSHPDGRFWSFSEGVVSRRYTHHHGDSSVNWITITADYAKGSSGGPILNGRGEVVGLVASTSSVYYDADDDGRPTNLQMVWKQCVPVEAVRSLIREPAVSSVR